MCIRDSKSAFQEALEVLRPVINHRLMQLLPLLMSGMQGNLERGLRKGLESRGE